MRKMIHSIHNCRLPSREMIYKIMEDLNDPMNLIHKENQGSSDALRDFANKMDENETNHSTTDHSAEIQQSGFTGTR